MKKLIYVLIIASLTFSQLYSQCTCTNCTSLKVSPTGNIYGQISDPDSELPYAHITISKEYFVTTINADINGKFFMNLPIGTYTIKVQCPGHQPHSEFIKIEENKDLKKNIKLPNPITMSCYGFVFAEETDENNVEKNTQGPFTGLEGHNFIEEPAIIYPNPVRDILNIKSTDPITVIEILNIHGQVEQQLDPKGLMDVSMLAAGTYYVRIHFENIKNVQVEKILIVK